VLNGFKQFIQRGNVVDMAVGVVVGGAFATVVAALTKDLLTPLIAALVGKPDFSAIRFTLNGSVFALGDFINAMVSFFLVATAVYFFVVLPVNALTTEGSKLIHKVLVDHARDMDDALSASITPRGRLWRISCARWDMRQRRAVSGTWLSGAWLNAKQRRVNGSSSDPNENSFCELHGVSA